MNTQKSALIAVRDTLQSLLDNYLISDTAMVAYKGAMVDLNNIIAEPEAAPVATVQPVTATVDVVAGVLAGVAAPLDDMLSKLTGRLAAIQNDTFAIKAATVPAPAAPAA